MQLDPGLAFGTGSHPTTAMCLDWLSRVPSDRGQFLDYGCGSGVLSIAALLLGGEQATAVDIDRQALIATRANAVTNGVSDRLVVVSPDVLDSDIDFNIVVANILAATLKTLAKELKRRVRQNGWLVLSGILPAQANEVIAAFGAEFTFTRWQRQQWVLLFARKR